MKCEDYPCCGHEEGGCPKPDGSFDCAHCGAALPKNSRSSLCQTCLSNIARLADEDPTGQDAEAFMEGE
jgi:hypothetical protein